ncbi:MAG TPA: methanogen output domain 1-containing protein [Candidatus Deferrimicrobium sp.]|nr:methanogen output domain 1-containing protein [Candidatus Deferrimicrobium sp.]
MEEKLKDFCSKMYLGLSMNALNVLREDMGLARAIQTCAKIWKNFGVYLAPILEEKYGLTEKTIPKVAETINSFLRDYLGFESTISESSDDKAMIVIKPCYQWIKFKEARLPPLCYQMCYAMFESIITQLNQDIKFQPGAQLRQGADRCELILQK